MAYDFLTLAACLKELQEQALGAKINKIHQPNRQTIILRYFGRGGQGKIIFCTEPTTARLHLTTQNPENPAKAPLFLMVMRKWLEGATIQKIKQTPYERVAELHFATRNELGDAITLRLIIEIMGKHSNLILVDHNGLIIDGIRRYDEQLSRYREVLPTIPYLPPPPQNKSIPPFNTEQLANILLAGDLSLPLEHTLSQKIAGVSPQLAAEIIKRADLAAALLTDELTVEKIDCLAAVINDLAAKYTTETFCPTLLFKNGQPFDFAAYTPQNWPPEQLRNYDSMSVLLDDFYATKQQTQEFNKQYQYLERVIKQQLSRMYKKIALQQTDLAASKRGDNYKEKGDLLAAYMYQLQQEAGGGGRGLTQIMLPGFEDPEQTIEVELKPDLTPQQNVQRYYRLYNKCRKAYAAITEQLAQNQAELEYLESINQSLANTTLVAELSEIERELRQQGYLAAPAAPRGGKPVKTAKESAGAALPPRRYLSADGFVILIGRNNKQNERLSLKTAATHDIWLHTQKIPGSHVIIVTEGKPVPDTTLAEAAAYAAWFSQAQNSSKVPVDYTLAAQVKKPQGAKPGMVVYFQQQTIYVEPKEPGKELGLE